MNRSRATLAIVLATGAAALALSVALAKGRLPEWRGARLPPPDLFRKAYEELAHRLALDLPSGVSRPEIYPERYTGSELSIAPRSFRVLGGGAVEWLSAMGRGTMVQITSDANGPTIRGALEVRFARDARPWSVQLVAKSFSFFRLPEGELPDESAIREAFARALLRPGEKGGPPTEIHPYAGVRLFIFPVQESEPPESVTVQTMVNPAMVLAVRDVGGVADVRATYEKLQPLPLLIAALPRTIEGLAVIGLFLYLLFRRRLDLGKAGTVAGAASVLFLLTRVADVTPDGLSILGLILKAALRFAFLFAAWAVGESWYRASVPGFTTSLDALRAARIGPRGGTSILFGAGFGAAIAGATLVLSTLSTRWAFVWPTGPSVDGDAGEDVARAVELCALCLVAFALSRGRRALHAPVAALFIVPSLPIGPLPAALGAAFPIALLAAIAFRRFGMTALFSAWLVGSCLPDLVYAAHHLAWAPGTLALSGGIVAALVVAGAVGAARHPDVEVGSLRAPSFLRRLEEERRIKHEMDLLARMQLGLLPARPPAVAGYDLAARSVLAKEAGGDLYDFLEDERGGLWVAAGDVSGHGYSCAIAQAMTKAALASLVSADRSPSWLLSQVDRVLRTAGAARTFTSLALLRLDPGSGGVVFSNAGHPYPLLCLDGSVRELPLPSLPVGQGPPRSYVDSTFTLEPGAALVLYSDGLVEAPDSGERPYGFDRARETLAGAAFRPAADILQCLMDDWRRHIGSAPLPDDTTIVVLKRAR